MQHSFKLLINTIASYLKIAVNALVTIFATRIALNALGADDFGLYNLVAGIIVLLSFVNGSLMISSQRFFSIAIGEKNEIKLHKYFNASLGIHILLGICVTVIFLVLTPLLFNGFLNIDSAQILNAKNVYYIMILSSLTTIASIPYSAIMNAHEDMAVLSMIDILSCLLKFVAAYSLLFFSSHLLQWYAFFMMISLLVKMILEIYWCRKRYNETLLEASMLFNKSITKEMLGFVGWNTLGSLAVLIRNQGVAVLLNVFFGTVVNAAYGIANQVNSLVLSFASTLTSVFTPMIIQAKGAGDDVKMIKTAIFSSKLSFLLSSVIALPLLIFLDNILSLWLDEIPDNTFLFCQYIIYTFLVLQIYPGINRAIYATGKIKYYQIITSLLLVLIIPIGIVLFKIGFPSYSIFIIMLILQVLVLFTTIYYANKYCYLNVKEFVFQSVVFPCVLFVMLLKLGNHLVYLLDIEGFVVMSLGSIFYMMLYLILYIFIILENEERKLIYSLINKIVNK